MAVIDLKDCTLTIKPAAASTSLNALDDVVFVMGEGNFTWTIARNIEYRLGNGTLATAKVREGDEIPMEVSFEGDWETVTSTTLVSEKDILDVLTPTGQSTDTDDCAIASCDIELAYSPTCNTEGQGQTYTFPYFRWENCAFDASAGTISVSGKCRAKVPVIGS